MSENRTATLPPLSAHPSEPFGVRLLSIAALGLLAFACRREPEARPVRLLDQYPKARFVTVGGDNRRAALFNPAAELRITAKEVRSGSILTALAAVSPVPEAVASRDIRINVTLSAAGQTVASCTIEGGLAQLALRWAPCRLHWERPPGESLVLSARADPRRRLPAGLRFALAEPVILPSGWPPRDRAAAQPIILVLLDTLRADHLALYGYSRPLGGNLAALARDGILFKEARAPSSWTRTSVATLLTGLSPFSHRVMGREDRLADETGSLAEMLQRAGYLTAAWSTNPNVLPLWGFAQGFDRFVDLDAMGWVRKASDARRVFSAAKAYLKDAPGRRLFLYLHLNDPHAPYRPPEPALRYVSKMPSPPLPTDLPSEVDREELQSQRDRYDAEILYTDKELGRFLRWLKRRGLYDGALIVVVGDHGEEFREHGGVFHGRTLYEEMLRVPLVLKLPANRLAGSAVEEPVGLEDIAPTLAAAAGLGDNEGFEGKRLFGSSGGSPNEGSAVHYAAIVLDTARAFSIKAGNHKLILDREGSSLLFDLARDPGERLDLSTEKPERARRLRSLLEGRISRATSGWHIKGCGGPRPTRLEAAVESTEKLAGIERIGIEPIDRVRLAPTGKRLEVAYDLRKRISVVEELGRLRRTAVPDEDEVAITQSKGNVTVYLTEENSEAISVRLGPHAYAKRGEILRLSPADPRTLDRPSAAHPCPGTDPMLWIWYITQAESVAAEAMDATVRERLRRLGYIE